MLKKKEASKDPQIAFLFFWLVMSFVIIYVEKERFSRPFELHSCVIMVSSTYEEEIRDFQDFQITLILCYEFCGYMCNKGSRLSRPSNCILVCYEVCVIKNKHTNFYFFSKMKMSSRRKSHFEVASSFWEYIYSRTFKVKFQ